MIRIEKDSLYLLYTLCGFKSARLYGGRGDVSDYLSDVVLAWVSGESSNRKITIPKFLEGELKNLYCILRYTDKRENILGK